MDLGGQRRYANLLEEERKMVDQYLEDQVDFIPTYKRSGGVRKSLKVANREGSQSKAWKQLRSAVKRCCMESSYAEKLKNPGRPSKPLDDLDLLEEIDLVERISALPELTRLTSEPKIYARWLAVNHGISSRDISENTEDFLLESWTSNDDSVTTVQPALVTPTEYVENYSSSPQEKQKEKEDIEEDETIGVDPEPLRSTQRKSSVFYDPVRDLS